MDARMEISESLIEPLPSIRLPCHAVDSGSGIPFEPGIRLPQKIGREMMHEGRETQLRLLLGELPYTSETA
jgi:hypothetical protein